jgi:NTE family protein
VYHGAPRSGAPGSLWLIVTIASISAFAVVFGLFVVVSAVLLILVIRFILGGASASRARWMAAQEDQPDEDEEDPPRGMTALVLAGGGTRGALQIGMLQVLTEHGFRPDRIYGSSVGAVNGVAFAGDPTREGVERMTQIWGGLTRERVYPQGRLHGPWLFIAQRASVYPDVGLRQVIEEGVQFATLEEATIPVEVVATSLTDGRERWFTYGPALEAVLASCAIPAIFPPVEIDGERYIDGAVVNNVPIRRAIDAGATRIVVLLCTPPVFTPQLPKRPVEAMLNALLISIHARFGREMAQLPPGVEVILCSGVEGGDRDFDDFSTTEALIAQGREEAAEVVRRYGLGVPGPAAPPPGPDGPNGPDGAAGSNRAGRPDRAPGSDGVDRPGTGPDGSGSEPLRPEGAAAAPLTHPDPGR